MPNQHILSRSEKRNFSDHRPIWLAKKAGLQVRMALSYVWVTAVLVIFLEILAVAGLAYLLFSVVAPFAYTLVASNTAERYALVATLRARSTALDPQSTFIEGQPGTLMPPGKTTSQDNFILPYVSSPTSGTRPFAFALLVAPDGRILASSYPQRYPLHVPASSLLPNKAQIIAKAVMGTNGSGQDNLPGSNSVYAAEPVWSQDMQPIGAIYVQITNLPSMQNSLMSSPSLPRLLFVSGLIILLILTPISALFGMMTMRSPLRRILMLVTATSRFATGDYAQRVRVGRQDEIGQLERHFNLMAQQLTESIQQQQTLTEQNARLAERTRMSRDLHDSIKQQVFALAAQIGAARTLFDYKQEETRTHLEIASELAYQVRQELSILIQGLRPSTLVEKGFTQALRDYLTLWNRQNHIMTDIQLQAVPQFPGKAAEELLHVVREALSNVARHSRATCVQISLEQGQEQITLTISDNGRGFDRTTAPSQSLGLQSMQERVEEIGGTFQLQSTIGQGTQIIIGCPGSEPAMLNIQQPDD